MKDSKADTQLRGLIAGLGYEVNDRMDLSPMSWRNYEQFSQVGVFENDHNYLKSLIAAALGDQMLLGGYGKVPVGPMAKADGIMRATDKEKNQQTRAEREEALATPCPTRAGPDQGLIFGGASVRLISRRRHP